MTDTKICKDCKGEFPKTGEYFPYANKAKGYLQPNCKPCRLKYQRERLRINEKAAANKQAYNAKYRRRKRKEDPYHNNRMRASRAIPRGGLI